jgi:large subunit ribosomal protein L10
MKRENPIPKEKIKLCDELAELIKTKKTILIASIKNIPASQFQDIGKKLRGKAIVKVPKKNLILRAINSSGNETVKKLKEQIKESVAILFSDLDCFDLSLELVKNKSPAKAKTGQLATKDIEVEAGPTELIPGPAVSELGALGIEIQIEKGKISIKKPKIIVKEGEEISANAAEIMNKLDIKPFSVGFIPICAFDAQEKKLYLDINIDREGTLDELKLAHAKAMPLAVEIGYTTEDTIKFLIGKAGQQERTLSGLVKEEAKTEEKTESEQKSDEQAQPEDKSEEESKNG